MGRGQTKCLVVAIALAVSAAAPSAWAIPTNGLVAWWPFEGNVSDASGNGHDGTVYGATLTTDRFGNPNSACYFDGINDYIDIGAGVKPYRPLSVAGWVRLDSPGIGGSIFRNDYVNSGSYRYGVMLFVANKDMGAFMFNGYSEPGHRRDRVSNEPEAAPETWHHAAAVFVSVNDIRLYWDGEPIGGTYDGTGSGLSYTTAHGALGLYYGYRGAPSYLHGAMDDVLVYDRALSDEEIRELFGAVPAPGAIVLGSLGAGLVGWLHRRRTL